jgi:hypothetical protein
MNKDLACADPSFAPAPSRAESRTHPPGNAMKLAAIVLIVAGLLGLLYGGFSYTRDKTALKLGPLELSVKERETVNVPVWLGVGAVVVGGLLLVFGSRPK